MTQLRGLIFDFDGTLLNTLPACYHGFRESFRKHLGRDYSDSEIAALFGPTEEGIFKRLLAENWQTGLADYLQAYESFHQEVSLFPGIEELLNFLAAKQLRLAIVSGKGPRSMEISLRYSRIASFFDPIITGADYGADKPAHIRQVLGQWQFAPETVAYIGDSAYDVSTANELGVVSIAALWGRTSDLQKIKAMNPQLNFEEVPAMIAWAKAVV